jgi:acetyltransferase-like isoleucine patch superfamily enzyme
MEKKDSFQEYKVLLNILTAVVKLFPGKVQRILFIAFKHTPGKIGLGLRYILFKQLSKECGDNVAIFPNVVLLSIDKISVGDNLSIHPNCYVNAYGGLEIGDNVSIAHSSSILTSNHTWEDKGTPIKYNPISMNPVSIVDDVWIGCGVRILGGIKVESRTIIAAGAVVNKNVKRKTLIGGVPAKVIKNI